MVNDERVVVINSDDVRCEKRECIKPETIDFMMEAEESLRVFEKELSKLINMHSLESSLEMPDYLIAKMMTDHLYSLIETRTLAKEWHSTKINKQL